MRTIRSFLLLIAAPLIAGWNSPALGGVTPENVVVVVNAQSRDSRTIADHYVQLREIPSSNVILLNDVPDELTVDMESFKSRILVPVLTELNRRRIAAQTRVIAYSAGFPTSVKIKKHTDQLTDPQLKKYQRPTASITGLTFLYRLFLANNPGYLGFRSNFYARGPFERHFENPFLDDERRERFDQCRK